MLFANVPMSAGGDQTLCGMVNITTNTVASAINEGEVGG